MQAVLVPNLPESTVKVVAITANNLELKGILHRFGIEYIGVMPIKELEEPVNSHPDMLLHHLGGRRLLFAQKGICDEKRLRELGFEIDYAQRTPHSPYPHDVALNAARVGDLLFANVCTLGEGIKRYCLEHGIKIIDVRQGYAKCSVCVVDKTSIITEDISIHNAAIQNGIDTLLIEKGGVNIERYGYGFIGGSSGLIAKDKLAFFKNVQNHPQYELIKNFVSRREVEIVNLGEDGGLIDVGSIIPLMTE